jgi:hypothetical protein
MGMVVIVPFLVAHPEVKGLVSCALSCYGKMPHSLLFSSHWFTDGSFLAMTD